MTQRRVMIFLARVSNVLRLSIQQRRLALRLPRRFVGAGESIEIARRRLGVVYPAPQQVAAVDHIDREPLFFVLVGKIAPDDIVRLQLPQRFEREREQSPGLEPLVIIVSGILDMNLDAATEFADVLVEGRLEITGTQAA